MDHAKSFVCIRICGKGDGGGERAGARTQDQRLKRAMLYQLSYPLALKYMVAELPLWGNWALR